MSNNESHTLKSTPTRHVGRGLDRADNQRLVSDGGWIDHATLVDDLTAFQQDILFILAEEARYGLAVKRALEDERGVDVNHGRLYPNLDTLVEMGLVKSEPLDQRTNEYEITDRGEQFCRERVQTRLGQLDHDADREAIREEIRRAAGVGDD